MWDLEIDDLTGMTLGPPSVVVCSGRIPLSGELDASVVEEKNYASNMSSARDGIAAYSCGGGVSARNHPSTITYAPESNPTRLEFENELGRFTSQR